MTAKAKGLTVIADGLNRGDIAFAQVATVRLRLPDLPVLAKGGRTDEDDIARLAIDLLRVGVLKAAFDPAKHPKWPAGAADGQGGKFRPRDSDDSPEATNDRGVQLADATAPSVRGRDGIPGNLPPQLKDGLTFLASKLDEPGNAQYQPFYQNWTVRYDESAPNYGEGKHDLAVMYYSASGSLTTFYGYVPKDWTPEKYRFFVAHEFAHALPENAATAPKERERNANELASRITGIPVPAEFRAYAKAV